MNDFKPDLQYFSLLLDYQFNDEHELKDTLLQGKYISIPFHPSRINTSICNGIRFNYGLFTQCTNNISKNNNLSFCNTCFRNTQKNNMIHPIATISQRNNTHFKDLKNRIPTPFHKICKKINYDPIIFKNTMDYFHLQYFSHDFDFNNNNHKNIIISDEHSIDNYITSRIEHINQHNQHEDYHNHQHNDQHHNQHENNHNHQYEDNHQHNHQHEDYHNHQHYKHQNNNNLDDYDLITTFPFKYNNRLFLKDYNDIIYHFHKHHQIGKFYSHNNIIIFN